MSDPFVRVGFYRAVHEELGSADDPSQRYWVSALGRFKAEKDEGPGSARAEYRTAYGRLQGRIRLDIPSQWHYVYAVPDEWVRETPPPPELRKEKPGRPIIERSTARPYRPGPGLGYAERLRMVKQTKTHKNKIRRSGATHLKIVGKVKKRPKTRSVEPGAERSCQGDRHHGALFFGGMEAW